MGYQLYRLDVASVPPSVMLWGASAASRAEPFALRSARSWKIRMAFGCMPVSGAGGGATSRANPRASHSVVIPVQFPAAFLYSTRSQPSTKLQGAGHALPVVGTQFASFAPL